MRTLIYVLFVSLLLPSLAMAQIDDRTQEAYGLYKLGMLKDAAEKIDEVVESKNGKTDAQAWHVRGFIYKDIYAKLENSAINSKSQEEAVRSFKTSMELDEERKLIEMNQLALKFLGVSYFNHASEIIDRHNVYTIDRANDNYLKYKSLMTFLYPDSSLKSKDVEFHLAMSTAYRKIYDEEPQNRAEFFEKSNNSLLMVLDLDPNNWAANYSYSVSFYNKGARNLQQLPNTESIIDVYAISSESMRSIEIALPFMLKAYEIDPDKIESIKGLKWILFNLHQEEESKKMSDLERLKESQR